jgi:hypothetical protein
MQDLQTDDGHNTIIERAGWCMLTNVTNALCHTLLCTMHAPGWGDTDPCTRLVSDHCNLEHCLGWNKATRLGLMTSLRMAIRMCCMFTAADSLCSPAEHLDTQTVAFCCAGTGGLPATHLGFVVHCLHGFLQDTRDFLQDLELG